MDDNQESWKRFDLDAVLAQVRARKKKDDGKEVAPAGGWTEYYSSHSPHEAEKRWRASRLFVKKGA
jgi:hypothetical protein